MDSRNPLNTDSLFEDCIPLMATAVAIPIAASGVYQSLRMAYYRRTATHMMSVLSMILLAVFTFMSVIEIFSQQIGCDRIFDLFEVTWYISSLLMDIVIFLRVYRSGLLSKIIAALLLVSQASKAFLAVKTILLAEPSQNQVGLCKFTVDVPYSLGVIGVETLCMLLLSILVVQEMHRRRTKEHLDWLTTVIDDGIFYLLGVAITQVVVTVIVSWNRWPLEFWIFQYLSWLVIAKFLMEQLEIHRAAVLTTRAGTMTGKPAGPPPHLNELRPSSEDGISLKRHSSDKSRLVYPNLAAPWPDKNVSSPEIILHTHAT
ncbi:hypothetical protein K493DRAFT_335268 [Basidiobolus meristosporus CBS 931.73]|uniref:Integral membrane protein n=1 Tax=Basidiobolus meristosporus CBS 931.73 TaxID=1314790 RepID=A0A1Y1YRW9_9FUNG|nr:hypothetical protein K493DRAFT_335268 [Basidiobolus meristosporus CBS 931.73]|eukprot:ORY00716.1 hypothetical protein K493DRAFT_335268 [Basidiobolus meristosporus CBS 931.73]